MLQDFLQYVSSVTRDITARCNDVPFVGIDDGSMVQVKGFVVVVVVVLFCFVYESLKIIRELSVTLKSLCSATKVGKMRKGSSVSLLLSRGARPGAGT